MGTERNALRKQGYSLSNDGQGYRRKARRVRDGPRVKMNRPHENRACKRPQYQDIGNGLSFDYTANRIAFLGNHTGSVEKVENMDSFHVFNYKYGLTHQRVDPDDELSDTDLDDELSDTIRKYGLTHQCVDPDDELSDFEMMDADSDASPGLTRGMSRGEQNVAVSLGRSGATQRVDLTLSPEPPIEQPTDSDAEEDAERAVNDYANRRVIGPALRKEIPKMLEAGEVNNFERRYLMNLLIAEFQRYHGLSPDDDAEIMVLPQSTVSDDLVAAEVESIWSTLHGMKKRDLRAFVIHCLNASTAAEATPQLIGRMIPARKTDSKKLFDILFGKDKEFWSTYCFTFFFCADQKTVKDTVVNHVVRFWIDPTKADSAFAKKQSWWKDVEDQTIVWRRRHFGNDDEGRGRRERKEPKLSKSQLTRMPKATLQEKLQEKDLETAGKREDLINRLLKDEGGEDELVPQGFQGRVIAAFSVRIGGQNVGDPVRRRGRSTGLPEGRRDEEGRDGNEPILLRRSSRRAQAPYSHSLLDTTLKDRIRLIGLKSHQRIEDIEVALLALLGPANLAVQRSKGNPAVWVIVPGRVSEVRRRKPWVWSRLEPWADALRRKHR
jgi:hypothetical protein